MSEHFYKKMSDDERTELNSQFLVDSWSYSKLSSFATNEKGFEMRYIYGIRGKSSSTTIAGSAYHLALDAYFTNKKKGHKMDLVDMEEVAFDYINEVKPNFWKLQKTTPSVDDCVIKAIKTVSALLKNFYREKGVYEDCTKEILAVELKYSEYLTINGVDIPLPCNAVIDLVVLTNEDKIIIIDHKSKNAFSDEKEISLSIGKQAITYTKCYESNTGKTVDEVWFVENKYSENRDKSPQLSCFKFVLDKGVRALYECLLYEPLKRMLEATSDPNYIYLINDSDNFTDKAELHEFWAKTMMAEVEDFELMDDKKEAIGKRLKKIRDASAPMVSVNVIKRFRQNAAEFIQYDLSNKNMTTQEKIEHVLRTFGIIVKVAHVFDGYSSNTYLLEVSAGVKIASIHNHRMDISNALDVSSIRLGKDLFVYQGKSYLSIESSKKRDKDLIFDPSKLVGFKIPIGIDNFNQTVVWDLNNHSTPHALICGATGSGKSVCIFSIIEYAKTAGISEIIVFDPKFEFIRLKDNKITIYNDIEDIEAAMELLVEEMNSRIKSGRTNKTLIVFDEFADAVSASKSGPALNVYEDVIIGVNRSGGPKIERRLLEVKKSLEENLKILLQKGRSCGFRIVAATQRASVKVITGDAKVNFPVQICFRVPKEIDSKVVIDEGGAESLAGMGDGLIKSPEYKGVIRFQAFYKPN